MKDMGIRQGSETQAKPLIIGVDTVYIHTDIQPVIEDGQEVENLFSYHEIQYDKDEYIQIMQDQYLLDLEFRSSLIEMGVNINDI